MRSLGVVVEDVAHIIAFSSYIRNAFVSAKRASFLTTCNWAMSITLDGLRLEDVLDHDLNSVMFISQCHLHFSGFGFKYLTFGPC